MSLNKRRPFSNSVSISLHMFSAVISFSLGAIVPLGVALAFEIPTLSYIRLSLAKAAVWG